MKIFFSGGLPKSGSNMIKNVLSENDKISICNYSSIGDALGTIKHCLFDYEKQKNRKITIFEESIKNFLKEGLNGWAKGFNPQSSVYIDDNRYWLGNLEDLQNIFNGKMIVFIRDIKSIINSFENIHLNKVDYTRENIPETFYEYFPYNKQLQRIMKYLNKDAIKIPLNGIHRIIEEKNKDNFYFIKYEDFVSNPNEELKNIYKFLDMPYFKHDLNNIKMSFDPPLCHLPWGDIRHFNSIEKLNTKNILNKESIMYIETNFKWFYNFFYKK